MLCHTYHYREKKKGLPLILYAPWSKTRAVDSSKYLGVKVTSELTWSSHISNIAGKANRSLGFLRCNFKQCTKEVKAATFFTMVRPVLDYASSVRDLHLQSDIKTLEPVQRRATRYVCNDYTTCTPGCVRAMVKDIG